MVFKCKMCGGDLRIIEGQTVCECEYCGSRQTVPALDSEKKATLFSRANRLRAMCEFDKAYSVYESIVADYPEEAEKSPNTSIRKKSGNVDRLCMRMSRGQG